METVMASDKPASMTDDQRWAIAAGLYDLGIVAGQILSRARRAALLEDAVPGWRYGSDLNPLSEHQAGDVLELIERRRRGE